MKLSIQDPRQFSEIYPDSNMLINQSLHDLRSGDNDALLCALIEDMLKQQQDQTLSVGFSLSPNAAIANYIWESLQKTINCSDAKSYLFALPIVLVIGSNSEITLNNSIDVNAVTELFDKYNVFGGEYKLYSTLVDIERISKLKPSFLYSLSQQNLADIDLTSYLLSNPITNNGEKVYLKFVVGCANQCDDMTISWANFNKCNMEFMQLVTESVRHESATIFPITFAPCRLSEATVIGNKYYNELAITFKLGNEIKKYRLQGKTPYIKISTADNQIKLELCIKDERQIGVKLNWNLHPVDSFEQINELLARLFIDMQLEVVYPNA